MGYSITWKEVVIHAFQKCAISLVPCCALPSADIGVVELSHEVKVYEHEAALFLYRGPHTFSVPEWAAYRRPPL